MAEKAKLDDILKRLDELKRQRALWEPLWKDVTSYVLPRRSFWDTNPSDGKLPDTKLYDDSPLAALQTLADGLQGYLVSPSIRWFKLRMANHPQNDLPGVADWLEDVEDVLYSSFQKSNFYQSISEYFTDGGSVGTAVMLIEDDVENDRVLFSTRHLKECYIAEDRWGSVDTLYREYSMSNRAAYQAWGNNLCQKRQKLVDENPFGRMTIIHAVYPRKERDSTRRDQENQKFASRYIDKDFNEDIDEGGFTSFPYVVWRYRKNSDEVYGRSPAIDAINSILRLNAIALTDLKAAQLSVEPPLNVPDAMRGNERIVPRGYNYYTRKDEVISPINLAQNYSIGKDIKEEIRATVEQHFRTTFFLLMEQAERQMTAREVIERQGEKAAILGVIMGGLNSETLIPTIDRVYEIEERKGSIPRPPASLLEGGSVEIEFMGPLAQAQKRYHESQGIQAGLQFIVPVGQMFPDSLDNIDADELQRMGASSSGMPQKVIREKPDVDKIRQQKAAAIQQAQQQQVALEQQKMLAQNADKLNKPLDDGGMLANVLQAAAPSTGQVP